MDARIFNVLFLCVGNSARSIIAECLINRWGEGRFVGFSAGSNPAPRPMPRVLDFLLRQGYQTALLHSKSWYEFTGPHAPSLDFVITLCDRSATEICPQWSGDPLTTHWGIPDPASFQGTDDEFEDFLVNITADLTERIDCLTHLPLDLLDRMALGQRLEEIALRGGPARNGCG